MCNDYGRFCSLIIVIGKAIIDVKVVMIFALFEKLLTKTARSFMALLCGVFSSSIILFKKFYFRETSCQF